MRVYYSCAISVTALGAWLMTLRDPTLVDSCQRRVRWFARVAVGMLYLTMISLIAFNDEFDESLIRAVFIVGLFAFGATLWHSSRKPSPRRSISILLIAFAGAALLWLIWYAWIRPAYLDYFQLPQGYLLSDESRALCLAFLGACSVYFGARYFAQLVRRAQRRTLANSLSWLGAAAGGVLLTSVVLNLIYVQYLRRAWLGTTVLVAPPKWMPLFSLVIQILQWVAIGLVLIAFALLPRARAAISAAIRLSRERAKASAPADKLAPGR